MPIDKLKKNECCGCNACGDVCPKDAITFRTDIEGFWYPEVNFDKCIDCELCVKVCPQINAQALKKNDFEHPRCFAAENKNLEVVFDSTSGGLFSAFADKFFREKGFVGGAVYTDDALAVKHYITADKKDLPRLRSSKYLQSDLTGFYTEVRELLKRGEKVVVCGAPCQMAGLRAFLRKDYDNLLILDFVCLGVNSPKIHRAYMRSFKDRYGSPAVALKAKSKEYGWRALTYKTTLEDGRCKYEKRDENLFVRGYIGTGLYMRPACYECKFRGFPRVADVSLADFWGIEKYSSKLEKNLGTSLVLINSEKGMKWFDEIRNRLNYIELPFESALEGNPALLKSRTLNSQIDRQKFFEDVDKMTFSELAEKYGFACSTPRRLFGMTKRELKRTMLSPRSLFRKLTYPLRHPVALLRTLRYNPIKKWMGMTKIFFSPYSVAEIDKTARLQINGFVKVGAGLWSRTRHETRLQLCKNSNLIVEGEFKIGWGSDIEVLKGGTLKIDGSCATNVNLTVVCANHIEIGDGVMIGRNVTIRDNNGDHYINRAGYKDSAPIKIGEKVWLCEGCTIMPGVTIGQGAIVAAHSVVTRSVKPFTMVAGNPAVTIDENVLWKY